MNSDDLAQRRARLTPEQRNRLAQRLSGSGCTPRGPNQPFRAEIPRRTPLVSYAQQRHWFLWQLEPLSTAYHLSGALSLTGRLDIEALRSSFDALVMRHESLRTVFRANDQGMAEQIIATEQKLDIPVIDLCDLPSRNARCARMKKLRGINTTPFDLTQGPLLRVALIKIAPEEHLLVVVMHHIVTDDWSKRIIIDEFAAHYRAHVQGQELSLPALPIQYADYAVWQRNWLEAGEKDRQLAYWRAQLGDTTRYCSFRPIIPGPPPPAIGQRAFLLYCPLCWWRDCSARPSARAPRFSWRCWRVSRLCCSVIPGG